MVKIAVCENKAEDLEKIKVLLQKYQKINSKYGIIIEYFNNPLDLIDKVEVSGGFELYMLDVFMKPIKGCQLAVDLKKLNKDSEIIFITTSKSHAIFAYEIEAMQYLLKPTNKKVLFKALDKFFKNQKSVEKYIILIKTTTGLYKLNTNEVMYSEPEKNNYQAIVLSDGKKLVVRMTVSNLSKLLLINPNIVRCGASLNINLRYITLINDAVIIFDNKYSLTYPFKAYAKLKSDFLLYKQK